MNRRGRIPPQIYRGVGTRSGLFRDPHVGKAGYFACPWCGKWVRKRMDGSTYGHRLPDAEKILCIGGYLG